MKWIFQLPAANKAFGKDDGVETMTLPVSLHEPTFDPQVIEARFEWDHWRGEWANRDPLEWECVRGERHETHDVEFMFFTLGDAVFVMPLALTKRVRRANHGGTMPTTPYRPDHGLISYVVPDPDFPRARRHFGRFDHDPCDDEDYLDTAFMDDSALADEQLEFLP